MFSCTYPTRYSRVETFAQRHKTNNIVIPHNIVIPREGGNPGIIKNMDARQRHSGMTDRKKIIPAFYWRESSYFNAYWIPPRFSPG
jgi:hypothetical protein